MILSKIWGFEKSGVGRAFKILPAFFLLITDFGSLVSVLRQLFVNGARTFPFQPFDSADLSTPKRRSHGPGPPVTDRLSLVFSVRKNLLPEIHDSSFSLVTYAS